jgi:hypothetical protein
MRNWLAPALVAVVAGSCYYWLAGPLIKPRPEREVVLAAQETAVEPGLAPGVAGETGPVEPAANPVALEYVAAYQQGRTDDIVRLTCWMQDRLGRLRSDLANPGDLARAMGALEARSRERTEDGNQLRDEGVEDQYVLAAGAVVKPIGVDQGRDDLERPARDRTWVRITYGHRPAALRDQDGLPIRSLVAGINVSEDGLVLKAGVIGNLDIDWDSLQTQWIGTGKERSHGAGKLSAM